jgi:hypothetical protein
MRVYPSVLRLVGAACLAAFVTALSPGAASAQPVKTATEANTLLETLCHKWGAEAKKAAEGTAAQRSAAVAQASTETEINLKPYNFAPEVTDSDLASATSKFRTCLDKEGRDALGPGTSVTVSLNPHIKNAKQPRVLDATITAIPGPKVATAVANKSLGKEWGEACLRQGSESCCAASAARACKGAAECQPGVRMCVTMVKCNATLNDCKKREMATDKTCSGDKCKACTATYKTCHDSASTATY